MVRAILLAGGKGLRTGKDIPKQYLDMGGEMMITRSLHALTGHPGIDSVRIVADRDWHEKILAEIGEEHKAFFEGFSEPGANRALSILNALNDMGDAGEDDLVLIHDAARPFVSRELISKCLEICAGHDGVMPGIYAKDTTYICENGKIKALLERDKLVAGQAPEAFRLKRFREAVLKLLPDRIYDINGSAEMAILDGMDVAVTAGEESNVKITTAEDVKRFL